MNPLLYADYYKTEHFKMYPKNMTKLYSNFTPRKSRIKGVDSIVVFGIQHFILEYLIKKFNEDFFGSKLERSRRITSFRGGKGIVDFKKYDVIEEYKRHCNVDTKHIEALWDLGYLPIEIKALPEGTLCPIGVPCMTITNTHPDFGWLVNYLETLISCMLWQPITSATIAFEYKKLLTKYANETDKGNVEFVNWQGHDFSMRGMSSVESAVLSGMGHLLSFTGTDTIPAIYQLETSYRAEGLIGASVPATEHSVMCMGTKESEIETFSRLLKLYPEGILSVVSDTWDLWKVCTEYLPQLKKEILARDGKLVIRPDSGDPVDIICGITALQVKDLERTSLAFAYRSGFRAVELENRFYLIEPFEDTVKLRKEISLSEVKGVIELLWDIFGGTINEQGFKVLDPHIGAIYGDSITLERAQQICKRLKAKGFASTNIVLGIGSYTYQYNTRDTFGFAVKATYGEITKECVALTEIKESGGTIPDEGIACACIGCGVEPREIWKAPVTDSGEKKSAKGLLTVFKNNLGELDLLQQRTWAEEAQGELKTVFKDGKLVKTTTLEEIRKRLNYFV